MPGPPPPPRLPPPPAPFGVRQQPAGGDDGRRSNNNDNASMQQQQGADHPMPNTTRSAANNNYMSRAPPPPMQMKRSNNNASNTATNNFNNGMNNHRQQFAPPAPPLQHQPLRQRQEATSGVSQQPQQPQHFNNEQKTTLSSQFHRQLNISNAAPSSIQQQQQQQYSYHGGGVTNNPSTNNFMPPLPPKPPLMANNHTQPPPPLQPTSIRSPQPPLPPPPMHQMHQQQQPPPRFSNGAVSMQPPPFHQQQQQHQQQQPSMQEMQSTSTSSIVRPPPPPSRPQYPTTTNSNNNSSYPQPSTTNNYSNTNSNYNNNNSNYSNNNASSNAKIDPSQIPRIPLFTRPHHAPATIYPSYNYNTNNNNNNNGYARNGVGINGSGVGGIDCPPPPPPLDSRYISNNNSSSNNNNNNNNNNNRNNNNNKNASPRLMATTTHTFPMDNKTLRSCGDLPLGLIVTPLGSLSTLCCRSSTIENDGGGVGYTNNNNDNGGGGRSGYNGSIVNGDATSTQWKNGQREQLGDIYSDNTTNTDNCRDVDHVISPFDGNGLVNIMSGCSTNTTHSSNNTEGNKEEYDDPERIPVIRGTKRSITVTDTTTTTATTTTTNHPSSTRMKTTQTITPPRCNRCNAYLNPYCTPSSTSSSSSSSSRLTNTFQGLIYTPTQSYNCNLCGSKSSIIISNEDYIANQLFETTALACGTVEYEVGGEYCVRGEEGAVQNVFLYAVEYVPEHGIVVDGSSSGGGGGGYVNQQQQLQQHHHHHHGTMKSHGWKESLDGIRSVARELCITAPQREEDGVLVKEVKIGIFAFCRDMLVFPYIKRRGHDDDDGGSPNEEEEEELAVAIVSDVTEDPFCPLPLNSWSYNVGDGLESKEWHRFCRILDSFTALMEAVLGESSHQQHHQQQQNDGGTRNCGGAALAVLGDALKVSGGKGTMITTRRPNYGVGALRDREAVTNYGIGSATEQKLFTPLQHLIQRNNDAVGLVKDKPAGLFYTKLGEECAKNRVCLDIVVTSSSVSVPSTDPKQLKKNPNMREFLDVATLGELCRVTCGHFKWLRVGNECGVAVNGNKNDSFTAEQLREELRRSALAYTGSDVVFKLRCSTGVQVKSYSPTLPVGNLVGDGIVNSAELELSRMHPATSIAVELEHKIGGVVDTMNANSRKGIDMPMVFFQSAVLYTTKTGQRRVRVSTLGLPTSKVPADIFRSADLGAVSTIFTRGAISDIERDGGSLRLARENVFNKCVSILANYRSHTTARTSPSGQLILPESLQLLPLFCLSLRKSRMLRHSIPKGAIAAKPFPTADERAYHIFYGRMVSPNMSLQCVHPHLFQVSDMRTRDGDWITPPVLQENKFDDANVIAASMKPVCQLPKTMNPSIACLDESGMYLLDDRFSFYLFIGRDVPDEKWQDLLSVGGVGSSRARGSSVPVGGLLLADTDSAHKLRSVIHQLRMLNSPNETLGLTARNTYAPLILVFVGRGSVFEEEMDSLLVDDPDTHERSYVDFLCDIHRSVRERDQT